ncbi:MAG: cyclic nucleotide-binding domain-containing protein [Candidatus Aminicenantaceae bacterium]
MLKIDDLKRFGIFSALNDNELEYIAEIAKQETYKKGRRIFQENSIAQNIYLVMSGNIEIRMRGAHGKEMAIDTVGPGEVFGWSAVTEPHAFTAASYAMEASEVFVVNGSVLRDLFKKNNHIGYKVMMKVASVISQRLRSLNEKCVNLP